MKIAVLSNRVPFVHGGAEELSRHLVRQLQLAGHQAEEVRLPFSWTPSERLYDEMLIAQNIRMVNIDRVIALKFPAYLVPHPQKVVWLLHQFRQAYDLFDAGMSDIGDDAAGRSLRQAIRHADEQALGQAQSLFAILEAKKRLLEYNGIHAEALSAPLNDPELFAGGDAGGYILAGGRVNNAKRQALLIQAMRYAPNVRLIVAGPPEEQSMAAELAALAKQCGVSNRVTLDLRFLPRSDIAALVNNCSAVAYIPYQEDSVGYVTMEAFHAGKPVISATDSGGVLEIVRNGETGAVASPTPEALGEAMVRLMARPARAVEMGRAARAVLDELALTWPRTLAKLLA
jgi:glycosyltransferase involved in cell wall biosynthesis